MNIASYDALLRAAAAQDEPQRMLFVFTQAELPDEHNPAEAQRFQAGQGGALTPIMYVDKTLDELSDFPDLVEESRQMGQEWHIVFVGALSGKNGILPGATEAQAAMDMMVKSIQQGAVSNFLAYDRKGALLKFV